MPMHKLTRPTKATTLTVLLALALALAGCGSSGKSSTSAGVSQSAAQFLAQGNAICAAGNAKRAPAKAKLGNNPSQAQTTRYVTNVFIPSIQQTINQLRHLQAPSGNEAHWNALLDQAQADLNRLKANPLLLTRKGPSIFHNFAAQVHQFGLTQCAKNA